MWRSRRGEDLKPFLKKIEIFLLGFSKVCNMRPKPNHFLMGTHRILWVWREVPLKEQTHRITLHPESWLNPDPNVT